ncbi:MAG: protein kinase, partial [Proteobacteria bacterium]|nr:protein kinase [Pseudomonadota bacterium]
KKLVKAFEAILFLHTNGFRHGDIRNDHLILESDTGNYVWIDFDYDFESSENPFALDLFGMSNVLLYALGKGLHLYYSITHEPKKYGDLKDRLEVSDFSLLEPSRFLNLRKIYPYIPKLLNDIVMHFSEGADMYYESAYEMIEDLKRCVYTFFS